MIVRGSTIWSLWLARNESMFNGKGWDSTEIFNNIRTLSLFWSKACDGMGSLDEYGWWPEPWNVNITRAPLHTSVNITWQPPQLGEFKFNVDGSARETSGPAGYEGVLRDSEGYVTDTIRATLGGVIFQHIARDGNSFVDMLAKHGADYMFCSLVLCMLTPVTL
ncbi:Uncharacterized protein TCM_020842 [Theobroma cacao]|uniref:RNase H type-1 domain-containing protein n=1 Tax=Theobroma cacao TaxID=3641 RepID=A0A061EUM6_THECC|nr:Uncharacterized protein TCM_020842 [Theobroma cacao]